MIDYFSVNYDNHAIIGDFNLDPSTVLLKHFMNNNALYNLINVNTCFKGKGTSIDLILTNRKYSFKNTNTFETGLSDHHHMIYTMLKSIFEKAEPIKLIYRDLWRSGVMVITTAQLHLSKPELRFCAG